MGKSNLTVKPMYRIPNGDFQKAEEVADRSIKGMDKLTEGFNEAELVRFWNKIYLTLKLRGY